MQVNLEQNDVEKAIALFLTSMGITAKVAEVSFKAGRSGSGLTTTVKLTDTEHAPIPAQANTLIPGASTERSAETQATDAQTMQRPEEGEEEPPFDPDSSNEEQQAEQEEEAKNPEEEPASDSLFK